MNLPKQGFKKAALCYADTYVLVLSFAYSHSMLEYGATSIFIKFSTGFRTKF